MRRVTTCGLVAVLAVVLAVGLFVAVFGLGVGDVYVHDHGSLDVTVDGEAVDFDQPAYHELDPTFHFH